MSDDEGSSVGSRISNLARTAQVASEELAREKAAHARTQEHLEAFMGAAAASELRAFEAARHVEALVARPSLDRDAVGAALRWREGLAARPLGLLSDAAVDRIAAVIGEEAERHAPGEEELDEEAHRLQVRRAIRRALAEGLLVAGQRGGEPGSEGAGG